MTASIRADACERRAFGRRATDTPGCVRIPGRGSLSCALRDISEGGALLAFAGETLPSAPRFWLSFADLPEVLCDVRHRRGGFIGVEFVGGVPPPVLRQIREPKDTSLVPPKLAGPTIRPSAFELIRNVRHRMLRAKVAVASKVARFSQESA